MGGICGFIGIHDEPLLKKMTSALAPRGGEAEAIMYTGGDSGLGWRGRVSDANGPAPQPAYNEDKSVCVVCDGEIYNQAALRERLESSGHKFVTGGAAETIAHAFEEYGMGCIELFAGEFVFAIWDASEHRMIVVRDRLGARPLYYSLTQDFLIFATSNAAVRLRPGFDPRVDFRALDDYLALGYIREERTFFNDIRRLHPGHMLICRRGAARLSRYWEPKLSEERGGSKKDWLDRFAAAAEEAVTLRTGGGPCGAVLDSGRDSAGLLSVFHKIDPKQMRTYSPFLSAPGSGVISGMEDLQGPKHTRVGITPADLSRLAKLYSILDEPEADGDALIFETICDAAEKDVFSIMTGAGLENLFAANALNVLISNIHKISSKKLIAIRWLYAAAALGAARFITGVSPIETDFAGFEGSRKLAGAILSMERAPVRFENLLSLFSAVQRFELYSPELKDLLCENDASRWDVFDRRRGRGMRLRERLVLHDIKSAIPCKLLYVNNAIAARHGLSFSAPFLDHRVVEMCLAAPVHSGNGGAGMSELLRGFIDYDEIRGSLPSQKCDGRRIMRGAFLPELRRMFGEYLSSDRLGSRGWFEPDTLETIRAAAEKGGTSAIRQAYSLMALEMWCESHLERK